MERKQVKVWYDTEGDYLEVISNAKKAISEKPPTSR
jgi:hypothetical protein